MNSKIHSGQVVVLVDRTKRKDIWWSGELQDAMMFRKKSAAEYSCKRLRYNNPEVVHVTDANDMMSSNYLYDCPDDDLSWDAHKSYR